ncbi:hypothetical protein GCM10027416_06060 [Okibacterium endophyticum]
MKLAMTIMVRDEADIIAPMLDHHLDQGVDVVIVTDNGSKDGTLSILQSYADRGLIDLRSDPIHKKQQSQTVTAMARDAYTHYGADWVINADADEFWLPVDRHLTLSQVFDKIPKELRSFVVPVVDMTGPPAMHGSGMSRLIYRDLRTTEQLNELGLLAHSTHDSVHVGDRHVEVAQGNHYVSIASAGEPEPELSIEVLHLPWRSWDQYRKKVENAGRAYAASDMTPSPNHHGIRDYHRLQRGTLFAHYIARHPDDQAIKRGLESGEFAEETVLAQRAAPVADDRVDAFTESIARADGLELVAHENALRQLTTEFEGARHEALAKEHALRTELESAGARVRELEHDVQALRNRRAVRLIDGVATRVRRLRARPR